MPGIVVDFSGGSCRVGLYEARTGKVEIIKNGYGNVDTPSYVAYTDHEKLPIVGEAARDQAARNPKNTVYDLEPLVGLDFSKAKELREKLGWPFEVCDDGGGKAAVQVEIQGVRKVYSTVEIASHLFAKMRRTAEAHINGEVRDAVVVVPWIMFPKQEGRTAVKEAANMAGLTGTVVTNSVAFFVESAVRKQPPLAPNGVHILHWDQYGINMAMWNSSNTKRWQWTRFSISDFKQWIGGMTNIGLPPIQQQFSQLRPTIKKVLHLGREEMLHEKLEPGMDDEIMVVWNLEKKVLHEAVLYGAKKWGEMGQGDGNDGEVAPWWFDRKFVFFDTGPGNVVIEGRKQIVQLACVSGDGRTFNVYTNPTNEEGEFEYEMKGGLFYYKEKDVKHTPRREALVQFCQYLQGLEAKVILVAHHAGVDMSPLIDHLVEFNMCEHFSSLVEGVTDTLCLFNGKNTLAHLKKNLIPIYQAPKDAHNALDDSWVLRELCLELENGADILERNHKKLDHYIKEN